MKKIANVRDVSTSDLYLTATKLLVNIDPESDFDPNDDELLQFYLNQFKD